MIIADENLHQLFVNDLLADGFNVISVRQVQVGMDDRDVAQWVLDKNALLITEDKDFSKYPFLLTEQLFIRTDGFVSFVEYS